jgi:hypothetical protein
LFDSTGVIVGTLTGGGSACDSSSLSDPDYYGKFSFSWVSCGFDSASRLQPWLDPDNTGAEILAGMPLAAPEHQEPGTFLAWPNPTTGLLRVDQTGNRAGNPAVVTFFDSRGLPVLTEERPFRGGPEEFDIRTFPTGLYVVRITGDHYVSVQKIIKY